MKTKLLLFLTSFPLLGYSQTPIQSFDSDPLTEYHVVLSPNAIDQSASGANVTWNFNSFSPEGTTTTQDTYAAPTTGELTSYPNTTSVQITTPTPIGQGANKVLTENIAGLVSITGIERVGLSLNYDGDNTRVLLPLTPVPNNANGNAVIGTFPLAYESTSTDDVSGGFIFVDSELGTLTGVFEGTITISVDAHGTLNTNDLGNGSGAYSGQVTRLKIEQNLIFNQFNAMANQLSYYYYDSITGNLLLRYTNFKIFQSSGTLFDIEDILIERLNTGALSVDENSLNANAFNIYPNPVKNDLNFSLNENNIIKSIIVSDITGRQVMNAKTNTDFVDVSPLKTGIYIMTAITNKGLISRKFIKE